MTKLSLTPIAAALLLAGIALAPISGLAQTTDAQLLEEVRRMRDEMQRLRAEVDALRRERAAAPAAAPAAAVPNPGGTAPAAGGAAGVASATSAVPASGAAAPAGAPSPRSPEPAPRPTETASAGETRGLSIFGYGEINYTRPRKSPQDALATVRRGVIGFGYRFDERTRMAIELELEDAIASASDAGEIAFEQFYVEHDLTDRVSAKAGLFLLPMGYLNEVHEPTRFYGVQRNFIETAIIPSTWREIGVGLRGTTDAGLRWDAGVVTGFDIGKWDAASTEGQASPLGTIHQEGSQARARSLAGYAALNWNGWPGVNLGGSAYHGGAGHKQPDFAGADARITLTEAHARWTPGRWDLSALAALGRFSGVDALNATFAGQPTPVPERFGGWYAQAAYRLWTSGEYRLVPFARFERFNTARGWSGLPQGLAPATLADSRVWTIGANFYLNPQVVLKLDYQRFTDQSDLDRFNVGVGFHF